MVIFIIFIIFFKDAVENPDLFLLLFAIESLIEKCNDFLKKKEKESDTSIIPTSYIYMYVFLSNKPDVTLL